MPIVEVKNLVKVFDTNKAVDGVSFSVEAGEVFGLLGPNGAGKSTLIGMISTLLTPTSGDVIVDGVTYRRNEIIWEINGVDYTPDQMAELGDVYWQITDTATVKVKKPGGLSQGYHDVNVQFGWRCNYIAPEREHPVLGINFGGFDNTRRLLIV